MGENPQNIALFPCVEMLWQTVAWNQHNMYVLGDAGAQEASLKFFKANMHVPGLPVGCLGYYMDFCPPNVERWREIGGLAWTFDLINTSYNADYMGQFQCLASTQNTPRNKEYVVSRGYFQITMQAMKDFRTNSNARGEGIFVTTYMLTDKPEWLNTIYEVGFLLEALQLMEDEPDEYDRGRSLDPIGWENKGGMTRCLHHCVMLMRLLAQNNSTRLDAVLKAGSVEAIVKMLRRVGDLAYDGVMNANFDPTLQVCKTLSVLAAQGGEPARAAIKKSGALDVISDFMSMRNRFGECFSVCNSFISQVSSQG